ncbi:MAG: carbonic anhydrase [Fimbriimonadaceae bacterium]
MIASILFSAALVASPPAGPAHGAPAHNAPAAPAHAAPVGAPTFAQALQRLKDGNIRYATGYAKHPRQDSGGRLNVSQSQAPFAIVLTCADSRVAPEIVFDQGLGDLFVVRIAGNVADTLALASMEYAVEHLHSSLIVVMGHERCGAVKATLDATKAPAPATGHAAEAHHSHIPALVKEIEPAIWAAKGRTGPELDACIESNVEHSAGQITSRSDIIRQFVADGKVQIVGGVYDLDTGRVNWLSSVPQSAFVRVRR